MKIKKFILYYMLASVAVVLAAGILIAIPFWQAGPPVDAGTRFMSLLQAGEFEEAYASASQKFKDNVTEAQMVEYLRKVPGLIKSGDITFYTRQIEDGFAKLSGHNTSMSGIEQVNVQLVEEDGRWKVLCFDNFDPPFSDERSEADINYLHFYNLESN